MSGRFNFYLEKSTIRINAVTTLIRKYSNELIESRTFKLWENIFELHLLINYTDPSIGFTLIQSSQRLRGWDVFEH